MASSNSARKESRLFLLYDLLDVASQRKEAPDDAWLR